MVVWGLQTAALRPLAGEGAWGLLERAGNYGVPLAFLFLVRSGGHYATGCRLVPLRDSRPSGPPRRMDAANHDRVLAERARRIRLRDAQGLEQLCCCPRNLAGHRGESPTPAVGGWVEVVLGFLVLVWPAASLLVFVWKVVTEALRPLTGEPIWEFIERSGSYGARLALFTLRRSWIATRSGSVPNQRGQADSWVKSG